MQPPARAETSKVDPSHQYQRDERKHYVIAGVLRKVSPRAIVDIERIARRKIERSRQIRKIAGPVNPSAEKCWERPECLLGPDVEPALVGIA